MTVYAVDTQSHYYPCFDLEQYVQSSIKNLLTAGPGTNTNRDNTQAVIFLTDVPGENWFEKLSNQQIKLPGWTLTAEKQSLTLSRDQQSLLMVCSRQLNTQEGIEILLLGCQTDILPDQPLNHYVEQYAKEYLLVLPWGLGKWLGRRGQQVQAAIQQHRHDILLGDNGGRPKLWSSVPEFTVADQLNVPILPGSDPLPIPNQVHRSGTNGVLIESTESQPENQVQQILAQLKAGKFTPFRHHRPPLNVALDQILLRLLKPNKK